MPTDASAISNTAESTTGSVDSNTAATPNTIHPQGDNKMSTELMLAIAGVSILTLVTAIAIITVLITTSRKSKKSNKQEVVVMGSWDPANGPANALMNSRSSSPLSSQWSEVDRLEAGGDTPVIADSELTWGSDMDQPVPNPLPPGYSGRSRASSSR